jgi:beta-ketodecanoyl-[acyl-carrier-protein] synthase
MHKVAISGTGVFTPDEIITNAELVAAYNAYAHRQNTLHAAAIEAGEREPLQMSSEEFIVKASGIERRLEP